MSKAGEIMAENRFAFVTEKNVQNVRENRTLFKYSKKVSKTNQGGLKRRRQEVKSVEHIEDPTDERSWNFLYHFYLSKLYSTV